MRDKFIRWFTGAQPFVVGAWWGRAGVCLVRAEPMDNLQRVMEVVYEPCGLDFVNQTDIGFSNRGEIVNALRCAAERLRGLEFTLALGIPSGDIFIKNIEIPAGLTTKQIEQISVVEAVSNLPVPPEEICADFLKHSAEMAVHTERIDIAFCKRGLIDELGIVAEDAGVVLSVVDRDIQAVHDATLWCANAQGSLKPVEYPLGILIEGDEKTFIVSRNALDHVSYVFKSADNDPGNLVVAADSLSKELQAYSRRAGLNFENGRPLNQLILVVDADSSKVAASTVESLSQDTLEIHPTTFVKGDTGISPIYGLMVALGMALRKPA